MGVFELLETGQLDLQSSWIRIDASGKSQLIEIDKLSLICHCGVSTSDLRILDALFVHPPTILRRDKAIVVNLEKIRCIITPDEVLLVNSLDGNVLQFVLELQKRLGADELNPRASFGSTFSFAPFEFRALAVAFEVVFNSLNLEASEIKAEAYPLLDELTSNASVFKLERLRGLKSKLVSLTRRIHKIKDEIERIKDDDEHMAAEMYSEKKREALDNDIPSSLMQNLDEGTFEVSDPIVISGVSSPSSESKRLTKILSDVKELGSLGKSSIMMSSEWELLLEACFLVIDTILTKLITLKEYICDTENLINTHLNNHRNRVIQFQLLLTSANFVMAIFAVVIGIFGINFPVPLLTNSDTIKLILIITAISVIIIYCSLVCFYKSRRVLLL